MPRKLPPGYRPLSILNEWSDNYNHNDVALIAASIRRFGANNALRVWHTTVMAGNHTFKALKLIKEEGPRPDLDAAYPPANVLVMDDDWCVLVVDVSHLTEIEARAFAIADNNLARRAVTDDRLLAQYLTEIAAASVTMMEATGFDQKSLDALLLSIATPEQPPDDPGVPEDDGLLEKWQVEPGQIWLIRSKDGRTHRLICGDCRDPEVIQRLCDQPVQSVFTSPPYAEQRKATYGGTPADEYVSWWEALQANMRQALKPDGTFFLNIKPHSDEGERSLYVFDLVTAMRRQWQWRYIDEFCWLGGSVPGDYSPRFKNGFEPVYFFAAGQSVKHRPDNVKRKLSAEAQKRVQKDKLKNGGQGRTFSVTGSGFNKNADTFDDEYALPSNVIDVPHDAGFLRDKINTHPASFPPALPEFFIKAYSDAGDVWLDPFVGSGSVFIAAERTERVGYGVEMMPNYCAIILERLSRMGLEPALAA